MASSLLTRRFLTAAHRSSIQSTSLRAASTSFQSHSSSTANNNDSSLLLTAAAALTTLAATSAANSTNNDTTTTSKCCGIAGVVGAKGDARDYLIEGLTILKNRGYDSAGIATMADEDSELVVSLNSCIVDVCACHFVYSDTLHVLLLYYMHCC